MGTINTVNAFLPLLRKSERERHIVLTASAAYFQPAMRMGAYTVTKYATVGYGEVLRRELAPEGIDVCIVFPAGMRTRHLESSAKARPVELGAARFDPADMEVMKSSGQVSMDQIRTADDAIRNLLHDLEDRQHYSFTHGDYRDQIVAAQRDVLAAFDRMLAGR